MILDFKKIANDTFNSLDHVDNCVNCIELALKQAYIQGMEDAAKIAIELHISSSEDGPKDINDLREICLMLCDDIRAAAKKVME